MVNGNALLLAGHASEASLTDSLASLRRGIWIAVPLASMLAALMAGLATRRALRPVGAITDLAATIEDTAEMGRVPDPDTGDEIEHLATTVNEMLARIERSRRTQRQFTSDAAHELRTPLMALQGELELAAGHPAEIEPELRDRLETLSYRLAASVDDLVLLATLDEGRPSRATTVDLLDLLREEALVVGADLSGANTTVVADPALLRRALSNLLANATLHARTCVSTSIEQTGDRVWVHVDDDGPGIDPDERVRVFERFARLDDARTNDHGGAGLGLAIVASVAHASAGGVSASTSPAGGARLSLWLPKAP